MLACLKTSSSFFIYPSSVSNLTLDSRNTVTVMSSEQARLFEYFSTLSSQAGCSFMKALYCISFLCQSPFPVAVLCQTTMTLCFLQVACRQACHEPWGLTVSRRTTSKPLLRLSVFKSFATLPFLDLTFFFSHFMFPLISCFPLTVFYFFFFSHLSCTYLFPSMPNLSLATSCFSFVFPCIYTSFPFCIPSSLLPLSRRPGQKMVCQTFPVQAVVPDHTS